MFRILTLCCAFMALSACAPIIHVSTQRDFAYRFDKSVPLYLDLGNDVSVSEKNAYGDLNAALARSGFNLVDDAKHAKVVMTFKISDEQSLYEVYDPAPYYLGRRPFYASPYWSNSFWYDRYPRVYVSDEKVILLRLFDADLFRAGKRLPLWEGTATGNPDALDARLQQAFGILVEKVGENYRGRVKLRGQQ